MTSVEVRGLTKTFGHGGSVRAVDGLDVELAEAEILVLLGPSGCGKTTALRCLAGLEQPDDGRITIGTDVVFDAEQRIDLAPEKRNIGMVFQTYALWPHKTVRENVAYPLRARRRRNELDSGWVEDMLRLVECDALLDRRPGELSGGQQQRVALARGLVARPGLVLFDEPLSNLDARLRDQLRSELHALHRRLGFTGVYVTHDQSEGLALGSRLAVLRSGRIEQVAPPNEIFERPATEYVAGFIGYVNRVLLHRSDSGWATDAGRLAGLEAATRADKIVLRLRTEDVDIVPPDAALADSQVGLLDLRVRDVSYGGRTSDVVLDTSGGTITATVRSERLRELDLSPGSHVGAVFDVANVRTFDEHGTSTNLDWNRPSPDSDHSPLGTMQGSSASQRPNPG